MLKRFKVRNDFLFCSALLGYLLHFLDYKDALRFECVSSYFKKIVEKYGPGTTSCMYTPALFKKYPMRYVQRLKILLHPVYEKLPQSIVKISVCTYLVNDALLKSLPKTLKSFSIYVSKSRPFYPCPITKEGIASLPSTLDHLCLKECPNLREDVVFPNALVKLEVHSCVNLLPDMVLPPSLKSLEFKQCDAVHTYPSFPDSLETLSVPFNEIREKFTQNNIKHLNFQSIGFIYDLPNTLLTLDVSFSFIDNLDNMPETLITLKAIHCRRLTTVDNLPASLKNLNVSDCVSIRDVDHLPPNLTKLHVQSLKITHLTNLPPNLKYLNMGFCTQIKKLDNLPRNLTCLIARYTHLENIKNLPNSIIRLDLSGCRFSKIYPLPTDMKSLVIRYSKIKSIDNVPESVHVDYEHSTHLTPL